MTSRAAAKMRPEGGSYRDRSNRVFYQDQDVLRALDDQALANWRRLRETRFYGDFLARGQIVPTEELDRLPSLLPSGNPWAAVLSHARIPFVSYPYEWSFGMLKAAALLHLDLMAAALEESMILKDSSAYNVQWMGSRPVFIDIPSFEVLQEGEPWIGYRQFCMLFLYPLMLQAYRGAPFQPWLRGAIDGIEPADMAHLLGWSDCWRGGVLSHVKLQAKLQQQKSLQDQDLRASLKKSGFSSALIKANVAGLKKLVGKLNWKAAGSTWSHYATNHSYSAQEHGEKLDFVRAVAMQRSWSLAWDLGGNTGDFSRILAENTESVVLVDGDSLAVERAFRTFQAEGETRILPLYMDLSDPSPDRGWRGRERGSLLQRGQPELVLALALVHHLVIGANVPLSDFVDWLADLGCAVVVEFVTRDDDMVKQLMRNREDQFSDYELHHFEELLHQRFRLIDQKPLKGGQRVIYHLEPA
ncbi:MAG: methyltransferase [Pseudomonadota bacterium]